MALVKGLIFLVVLAVAYAKLPPYDFSVPARTDSSPTPPRAAPVGNDPFLGVKYHSGYINVGRAGGEMFYWFFPNAEGKTSMETPFIIWLTGGPGCSSELAALTENGPLTVEPDATIQHNMYSWHQVADVVYIDQPLGTGFSSVGDPRNYVTNEKIVAQDMREFLEKFVELYPTLKNKPFYVTGESYAGHYIPSVAHELLRRPVDALRLTGIAIGNGWVDPALQYPAYADFAFEHNMVGEVGYQIAKKALEQCVQLINKGMWPLAIVQCNTVVHGLLGKKNPYDVRLNCDTPPMCYNSTSLDNFMNQAVVQRALGVHKKWKECDGVVYSLLLGDWITQMRTKVAEILEAGVRVLIYSGDQDFICNWRGGLAWTRAIDWDKAEEFNTIEPVIWNVDGKPAGEYRRVDNLTFLRLLDAGHMVPMDQPEAALSMIREFLQADIQSQKKQRDFFEQQPMVVVS